MQPLGVRGRWQPALGIARRYSRSAPAPVEVVAEVAVLVRVEEDVDGENDAARPLIYCALHQCLLRLGVSEVGGEVEVGRAVASLGEFGDTGADIQRFRAGRCLTGDNFRVRPQAGLAAG